MQKKIQDLFAREKVLRLYSKNYFQLTPSTPSVSKNQFVGYFVALFKEKNTSFFFLSSLSYFMSLFLWARTEQGRYKHRGEERKVWAAAGYEWKQSSSKLAFVSHSPYDTRQWSHQGSCSFAFSSSFFFSFHFGCCEERVPCLETYNPGLHPSGHNTWWSWLWCSWASWTALSKAVTSQGLLSERHIWPHSKAKWPGSAPNRLHHSVWGPQGLWKWVKHNYHKLTCPTSATSSMLLAMYIEPQTPPTCVWGHGWCCTCWVGLQTTWHLLPSSSGLFWNNPVFCKRPTKLDM